MQNAAPAAASGKRRILIIGLVVVVMVLLALAVFTFMIFRARAEGIAIGYLEAAVTSYQMDRYTRPLPDRMFETQSYLVDTKSHGTPPTFEVTVKGYYSRFPYFFLERTAEGTGRAMASPMPGESLPPR